MRAFCCWSGGKESALSLYKAKEQGICVSYLLNMVSEDGRHSRTHGISSDLLRKQALCIGISLVQQKSSWQDYEKKFKEAVSTMDDIEAGIFGDIDLVEHRDWVERVCKDLGIKPILPLWNKDREKLMREFIKTGFKAVVVSSKIDSLIGRSIDKKFIEDLKTMDNIDLCGEKGEYHTFVFNGPIFKEQVEIK